MGIKKNIVYSTILTTSNYIFPLLVYPYVARVLGVTNIGLCNFIDNIINYFILFSMMGINIMGNRQIATDRATGKSLNDSFSNLFSLNAITTLIAIGGLVTVTLTIPTLRENHELMWFGCIKLISNFFLIEWFYKGMENFRYITVRTIIVKSLYVIAVFLCVRNSEDYTIYYLLTVLMVSVNAIINSFHSRKYVSFSLKGISFRQILRPFLLLGVYMLVTSLCTSFNVVYLGFVTDDTQVGYYTTATKLYSIMLAFFTGVTSVMLPRMSNLIASGQHKEFKTLLGNTTSFLFAFSIPIIILSTIFAPQIILLISGPGYEGAITPMRIVMPLMLIIGYEQITVIQGLMPLKADKSIMINSSAGAVVSLILNIFIVHSLKSVGSSIAWVSSEFTILVLSQITLSKILNISFPFSQLFKNILAYIPLCGFLIILYYLSTSGLYWLYLIIASLFTVIYTFAVQIIFFKNPFIINLYSKLSRKKSSLVERNLSNLNSFL